MRYFIIGLLTLALFFSSGCQESSKDEIIVSWVQQNAIPLSHVEAGHSFEDLQPLKQVLQDVHIVGLGEATHGTREFFQVKHRLLEFLVTEMEFNAFSLEDSYSACEAINEYVLYGKGDRASVLSNLAYVPWDTEEFSALLDWVRTYNQGVSEEKKVRFYGQDPVLNNSGRQTVLQYLRMHSPGLLSVADSLFHVLAQEEAKWPMQIDDASRMILEAALPKLDGLQDHLATNRERLVSLSSVTEFEDVSQYVRMMEQFAIMGIAGQNAVRSPFKAENVSYIINHERPGAKLILWEHNEHITGYGNESELIGDSLINPYMGEVLRRNFGNQYYAFGFEFNEGTYQTRMLYPGQPSGDLKENSVPPAPVESLPWYLSQSNIGNMILDVRQSAKDEIVDQWLNAPQMVHQASWGYQDPAEIFNEIKIGRFYDGIIYIDKTTATRPTNNALEAVSRREKF